MTLPPGARSQRWISGVLLALLLLVPLAPVGVVLWEGLGGGAYAWSQIFESRRGSLFWRSVWIGVQATLWATLWGMATGYVIARARRKASIAFETLSYLPLLLPNIVIVLGWIHCAGNAGWLARWTETWGWDWPFDVYSTTGVGFVLALCYFPFATIFAAQGFRALDPRSVQVSRLYLGRWARWRHMIWPVLGPAWVRGGVVVFCLSFADYGVPSSLMVNVYSVEVFAQVSSFLDSQAAIATALPPFVLVVALIALREWLGGPAPALATSATPHRGCSRVVVVVASAALVLALVVPLAFLLVTAGGWETYPRALRIAGAQIMNSLHVGFWGGLVTLIVAAAFVSLAGRVGRAERRVLDLVLLSLLMVPGSVVGLGILSLVSGGVVPWAWIYPHEALVGYASACRYLVFPVLILTAVRTQLQGSRVVVARAYGVGWLDRVRWIQGPVLGPAWFAAGTLSLVLCMGELTAAVLVNPPGAMTLPVRLASLLHFGEDAVVAALCTTYSVFLLGLLLWARLLLAHRFDWFVGDRLTR